MTKAEFKLWITQRNATPKPATTDRITEYAKRAVHCPEQFPGVTFFYSILIRPQLGDVVWLQLNDGSSMLAEWFSTQEGGQRAPQSAMPRRHMRKIDDAGELSPVPLFLFHPLTDGRKTIRYSRKEIFRIHPITEIENKQNKNNT